MPKKGSAGKKIPTRAVPAKQPKLSRATAKPLQVPRPGKTTEPLGGGTELTKP